MLVLMSAAVGLLSWATQAVFNGNLKLYPRAMGERVQDFPSKLEFLIKWQVLPMGWMLINILYVMLHRVIFNVNPMVLEGEQEIIAPQRILTNTVEQTIFSFGVQLLLLVHLDIATTLKAIPLMNLSFFVGRFAFLLGYPMKRSFGFPLTFLPSAAGLIFVIYRSLISFNMIKV